MASPSSSMTTIFRRPSCRLCGSGKSGGEIINQNVIHCFLLEINASTTEKDISRE